MLFLYLAWVSLNGERRYLRPLTIVMKPVPDCVKSMNNVEF